LDNVGLGATMRQLLFVLLLGFHQLGICDFGVKCQFVTHETVFTDTGEVFSKAESPYIIGMTDLVLTIGQKDLRIDDPVIPSRFFLAETCKVEPTVLGYDCFAIKNYIQKKVPAIYVSKGYRLKEII